MNHRSIRTLLLASIAAAGTAAQAVVTQLDFEGLQNLEPINNFYNGGLGGFGSGPGPNFGVIFNNTALAVIDSDAGGSGNFGGEPSPDTIMFFLEADSVMTVPAGFDTGFSFFYTAIIQPGLVEVWDGPNATGNMLASQPLPLTPFNGAPDPTGQFSPLLPIGVAFNGIAQSVRFAGTADQIAFDNITFGSVDPQTIIPETSTVLSGLGLAGLAGFGAWRRFRRA